MKKIIKTTKRALQIDREIVRTLRTAELCDINGGQRPVRPLTRASNADACCA